MTETSEGTSTAPGASASGPFLTPRRIGLGAAAALIVVGAVWGARLGNHKNVSAADCEGKEECSQLCDKQQWRACVRLGTQYWLPRRGARDLGKAEALYRSACDHGDAMGCFSLGRMYEDAIPMEAKAPEGAALLRKAAEGFERECSSGNGQGCLELSAQYASGRGVERNREKSNELKTRAATLFAPECDKGVARACASLASLAWGGSGGAEGCAARDWVIRAGL